MSEPVLCDVVLPFHNQLPFLQQALESICGQRGVRCAVHIVDDASTDDTTVFRERWADVPDLFWYRNERNIGPYRSLHRVFEHLQSEFIAIQDADDISEPDRIARSLDALVENDADIFGAAVLTFGDDPADCGKKLFSRVPFREELFVLNSTMVVRRAFFQRINGFADFFCSGDCEFGLRALFADAQFCLSDRVVSRHREHAQSLTRAAHTGWHHPNSAVWFSPYRLAVWDETNRRRALFEDGETDFEQFGCLDPDRCRTLGCIPEPCDFDQSPALAE